MSGQGVAWRSFEWRCGAEYYRFEVSPAGDRGALSIGGAPALEMPMLAWKAVFDAIGMKRYPGERGARYEPARAGQSWTEEEDGRLVAAFRTGRLLSEIARAHSRTEVAIASRLVILGLAHRGEFPHLNRGVLPVDDHPGAPPPRRFGAETPASARPRPAEAGSTSADGFDEGRLARE